MKEFFSTFEIARLLNLSPYTLRIWAERGILPCYRTPGGHRRIKYSDLIEFLKKNRMPLPSFLEKGKRRLLYIGKIGGNFERIKRFCKDFQIYRTESPLECGYLIAKEKFDLILLDFDQKKVDFKELGRLVKNCGGVDETIMLGISKEIYPELVIKAERSNFYDVFTKPISEEEFKKKILNIFFKKREKPYRLKREK